MSQDRTTSHTRPTLDELTDRLIDFRDERDWRQFQTLKDLILSLNLEASELLELTQWKGEAAFEAAAREPEMRARIAEESADILNYLLLITERAGIDLLEAAAAKIELNGVKYPIDKARGNARKYTEF